MRRTHEQLRADALAIWQAGVAAVDSERLVGQHVALDGPTLTVGDVELPIADIGRIVVVGAGKAGAGMAQAVEAALARRCSTPSRSPAGSTCRPIASGRCANSSARGSTAGVNEPTAAGLIGTERILELVAVACDPTTCASASYRAAARRCCQRAEGISLADKLAVTRHLSAAGANIGEMNTVRKQLSRIKGGGLAGACRAGRLITLIISDVPRRSAGRDRFRSHGDRHFNTRRGAGRAGAFQAREAGISPAVFAYLERALTRPAIASHPQSASSVTNLVIGNNAAAVDAAGIEAELRGYSHAMTAAQTLEGAAEKVGQHLADMASRMRVELGPDCLITGGEPTVQLIAAAQRGRGGRNQQLVLAALQRLIETSPAESTNPLGGIALLSGGTDGEDGPTDAAGALIDETVFARMRANGLGPDDFLRRNDAYHFFARLDGAHQDWSDSYKRL